MKRISSLIIALLLAGVALSQDTLTLDQAIATALAQNHGILVANNDAAQAANQATRGNAGQLPSLSAAGSYTQSVNNTRLEFASPETPPIEQDGARSETRNASLTANYTLFNGFRAVNTYQSLQRQSDLSNTQSRATVENTLMDVITAYYEVARLRQELDIAESSMTISRDRLQRSQLAREFGTGSRIAVLSAQVDLNNDSTNLITAQLNLEQAQRNLGFLLGKDSDFLPLVSQSVVVDAGLQQEQLAKDAKANNASLIAAAHQLSLAGLGVKTAQAPRYPTIGLSASYAYSESQSDANFVLANTNTGFTGGISLSYTIFNGGQANTALQNARISLESSELRAQEAENLVQKEVANGYAAYRNRLQVLALEQSNIRTAELNFERTQEALRTGQATGIEFREAQLNLAQTQLRFNSARFAAKVAEMSLLRLAGKLVNN